MGAKIVVACVRSARHPKNIFTLHTSQRSSSARSSCSHAFASACAGVNSPAPPALAGAAEEAAGVATPLSLGVATLAGAERAAEVVCCEPLAFSSNMLLTHSNCSSADMAPLVALRRSGVWAASSVARGGHKPGALPALGVREWPAPIESFSISRGSRTSLASLAAAETSTGEAEDGYEQPPGLLAPARPAQLAAWSDVALPDRARTCRWWK